MFGKKSIRLFHCIDIWRLKNAKLIKIAELILIIDSILFNQGGYFFNCQIKKVHLQKKIGFINIHFVYGKY